MRELLWSGNKNVCAWPFEGYSIHSGVNINIGSLVFCQIHASGFRHPLTKIPSEGERPLLTDEAKRCLSQWVRRTFRLRKMSDILLGVTHPRSSWYEQPRSNFVAAMIRCGSMRGHSFRVLRPRFWRKRGQVEIFCDYAP